MHNHDVADEPVSVALLYQTSQLEGHLKDALNELGAAVVYEALTAEMDRDALEGSGAHVVIVNLDPEIESHLEEVYDLLDDDRYNVVFNDAQVSSNLSGWEQARWSRHLAAKIMGRPEVADPPRPAGAEAPPSPAQKIARSIPDVPVQAPPSNTFAPDAQATSMFPPGGDLDSALGDLLAAAQTPAPQLKPVRPDPGEVRPANVIKAPPPPSDFNFDLDSLLGDIPSSAAAPGAPKPAAPAAPPTAFAAELDALAADTSFDFDLGALDAPAKPTKPAAPVAAADADDFGLGGDFGNDAFADLGKPAQAAASSDTFDLADDLDNLFGDAPTNTSSSSTEPTFDFDLETAFGESTAQDGGGVEIVDFDAAMSDLATSIPGSRELPNADDLGAATTFDLPASQKPSEPGQPAARGSRAAPSALPDWGLEPVAESDGDDEAPAAAPTKIVGVEKISAAESLLAGSNWSLEAFDDDKPAGPPPTGPADFGVEKVEAQDYLAPEGGDDNKFDFDTSLKLDLIPMEEAVSPERRSELVSEHRLDEASGPMVRNVVVLGASIGGPEAVREYLSALPARFPVLFVLAQHMGAEFLELMAAQLAKATPLTVRSPAHGDRVGHGEILVVPTTHRLLIEPSGVVQLAHLPEASPYTPSIDLVIRDVADRFKTSATAIIFSGMAHDAIDGSKHLASVGGKVWAQDPDTCVISSMVDGARDAGIVSFVGSPSELAQFTIATYRKA